MDLTTPEGVTEYMKQSTDEEDWNRRAEEVIEVNGGSYPKFWFETVIQSGIQRQIPGSGISVIDLYSDGTWTHKGTYN